jgi:hypothetical protein
MEEKKFITAEELESARQDVLKFGGKHLKRKKVFRILAIICLLALVPAILFLNSLYENSDSVLPGWVSVGCSLVGLVVFMGMFDSQHKKFLKFFDPYNTMYKIQFLHGLFQSRLDKIYAFEPQNGISREIVEKSGIFPSFEFIKTNDYLRASHNGLNFEYCDLRLEAERTERDFDGDKVTRITSVFNGVFIIAELGYSVHTPIFISSSGRCTNIITTSEIFNSNFSIECENAVDALRTLTPQATDNLLKLKKHCKNSFSIAFIEDKLYFETWTRDLFELKIDVKKPISEIRQQIDQDVDFIMGILNFLNMR